MIETLTCPNCGKTIKSNTTHGLEESQIFSCKACKHGSLLRQWRFREAIRLPIDDLPSAGIAAPPQILAERTERQNGLVQTDYAIDRNEAVALWIAGGGLLLTGLSPFAKWVNIGMGGVTGLVGDGKIVMAMSLIAIGAFVLAIVKRKWMTFLLLPVQACGIIVAFWMAALLWKLSSLATEAQTHENPFTAIFTTILVSPGIGLYIGLVGGTSIAGALSYMLWRRLFRGTRPISFVVIQTISFALGISITTLVVMQERPTQIFDLGINENPRFNFGMHKKDAIEAELGKPFTLGNLQITPVSLEFSSLHKRSFLGELQSRTPESFVFTFSAKNISEGQVFTPFTIMEVTDNVGNKCDDPTEELPFSGSVEIGGNQMSRELRSGESANVKVAFDPKSPEAQEYTCMLTTSTSNQDSFEEWQIRLEPSDIKNGVNPNPQLKTVPWLVPGSPENIRWQAALQKDREALQKDREDAAKARELKERQLAQMEQQWEEGRETSRAAKQDAKDRAAAARAEADELMRQQMAAVKAFEDAKYRTWQSPNGRFRTEAQLISLANNVATLQKRNGKKIKVQIDKLHQDDREFIRKWRSDRR